MAAIAVLVSVVTGCGTLEDYPDPASVFQATFNSLPGPGISILQANGRAFADDSTCYLRLKVSPAAFSALTATGFTPITGKEYQVKVQNSSMVGPLPSWWNPLKDTPTVFLYSTASHPGLGRGQAIVAYNPTLEIMNFYWDGMD